MNLLLLLILYFLLFQIRYKFIFYQIIQISLILLHYLNALLKEQC